MAKTEGSRCLAVRLVGSVLLCTGPITAFAVVRAEVTSEIATSAAPLPSSQPPSPELKLAASLAAMGGKEPRFRDTQPSLELQASSQLADSPVAPGYEAAGEPARLRNQPAATRVLLAAASADSAVRDFPDDDEEGSDAPVGPAVVLGDMPGRRPPPVPGRDTAYGSAIPGAPQAGQNIPVMPGMPCIPLVPCVPGRSLGPYANPSASPAFSSSGNAFPSATAGGVDGSGGTAAPAGGIGDFGDFGLGWGLAPIRWGGSVGVQVRRQQAEVGSSVTDTMGLFNLRAASYIYQPWLAQVSGNIGLSAGKTYWNAADNGSSGGGSGNSSDNQNSVVGGATLQVFPQSRFPFMASFDRSNSRTNGTFVTTDYTNTRFNLRQSYRTEDGAQNGTIGYDRSNVETVGQGSDVVNAVYGDYSHAFENQTSQVSGRYSETNRDYNGENSRLMNYYARHTYRYEDNLNLETSTVFNDNNLRYLSNNALATSHGRYLQMSSSASWRPEDEDIPLSVTGGIMALSALNEYNNQSSDSKSMSANLSATYAYSPNLMFMGTGLVTRLNNNGGGNLYGASSSGNGTLLTNMGGAVSYNGDPLTFGNYSYNWNTGGTVNRQTGGTLVQQNGGSDGSNTMTTVQASHSLNREYPLSTRQSVSLTASQSISHSNDQLIGNSNTFTNTGGATWRINGNDNAYGSVGLSLSDMQTTGANEGHYRYVYLQLNGNGQLSPRSSLNANITIQWSMQDTPTLVVNYNSPFSTSAYFTDQTRRTNIFGSASYTHMRAFDVQGLRYTASVNANTQMTDARLYGDASANPERYTYWLENRLDYRIGRLDFSAIGTLTEIGGKKNAQVFFRVTREFGKF